MRYLTSAAPGIIADLARGFLTKVKKGSDSNYDGLMSGLFLSLKAFSDRKRYPKDSINHPARLLETYAMDRKYYPIKDIELPQAVR